MTDRNQIVGESLIASTTDVDKKVPISDAARRRIGDEKPILEFCKELMDAEQFRDAIVLLAFSLPSRIAVWWGALCAWHATGGKPSDAEAAALIGIVHWVAQPTDEHQQRAKVVADSAGTDTPVGCCARAVFWAGALTPKGDAIKPVDTRGTAKLVAATALNAIGKPTEDGKKVTPRDVIQVGLSVARGKTLWYG